MTSLKTFQNKFEPQNCAFINNLFFIIIQNKLPILNSNLFCNGSASHSSQASERREEKKVIQFKGNDCCCYLHKELHLKSVIKDPF